MSIIDDMHKRKKLVGLLDAVVIEVDQLEKRKRAAEERLLEVERSTTSEIAELQRMHAVALDELESKLVVAIAEKAKFVNAAKSNLGTAQAELAKAAKKHEDLRKQTLRYFAPLPVESELEEYEEEDEEEVSLNG